MSAYQEAETIYEYRVTCLDGEVMEPISEKQVRQHLAWRLPNGQPANCGPHRIERRPVVVPEWEVVRGGF